MGATRTTVTRSRLPFESAVATGRGDDGSTGLLFGGKRIAKDDPRTEAYGTIDEAVAALGLARAELNVKSQYGVVPPPLAGLGDVLLRLQRELFVAGAELATNPEATDRRSDGTTRVSADMVAGIESILRDAEAHVVMPREFVVPGETRTSAAIELARTTIRRAERRVVSLDREGRLAGSHLLPYLKSARRSALDPGPRRGAGRIASRHTITSERRPAAIGIRRHRHRQLTNGGPR